MMGNIRNGPRGAGRAGTREWCALAVLVILFVMQPDALPAGNARSQEWFWMFYETDSLEKYGTSVYRPFFMKNRYANGREFEASLMPVVYWRYTKDHVSEWKSIFGLAGAVDFTHQDGVRDYDLGIFPVFFCGDSTVEKDRYLMAIPFGGTIKGKLAQDRISAYAFPGFLLFFVYPPRTLLSAALLAGASLIPAYADYESGDYRAKAVLWPLVQWGSSPTRNDFRLLPFYAHNYKKDVYDNYSYLFIFNEQNVRVGKDVQRTLFAMPIIGRRWSDSGESDASTLLWPFFSWGFNRKSGDFELNFPWPLVMIQDSRNPEIYKRIFFPFYGKYVYNTRETFFISPLHFTLKHSTESFSSEYYINALIVWYFKRDYLKPPDKYHGASWRYFKVWPLFHYEYDGAGNTSFNLLSILPFRDPEGYELLYQPFWTLFEYRKLKTGEKRLGLLLRTYYQRWGEDFLHIKVPLLFTFREEGETLTELSVLASMFGYGRDREGTVINIFWVPIRINSNGVALDDAPGAASGRDEAEVSNNAEPDYPALARLAGRDLPAGGSVHYSARFF